jgi:hypothetical protein
MVNKPKFISFLKHGESDFPAPLIATNDSMFGFILESDRDAVQRFVDSTLGATGSGISYKVLGNHVILLFQHCAHFTSPINIGWAEDFETAILVPLVERKPDTLAPEKLLVWIPYLTIDVALGLVTGRDVWGYNKTLGSTKIPSGPNDPGEFTCDTLIFRKFDPNRQAETATLIKVTNGGNMGVLKTLWHDAESLIRAMTNELGPIKVNWNPAEVAVDLLTVALGRDLPLINLKQMRDTEQSELACYQALVEAKLQITHFDSGGLLNGEYKVSFCPCDSHQIVQDFGFNLVDGTVPVRFAFWAKLDFTAPPGTTIWEAA